MLLKSSLWVNLKEYTRVNLHNRSNDRSKKNMKLPRVRLSLLELYWPFYLVKSTCHNL